MKYALLFMVLLTVGCAREPAAPTTRLSFRDFVSVMSDLGISQPQQRTEILRKHNTSDADLRAFVAAYASDPRRLSAAFDSVERMIERKRASNP